MGIGTRSSSLVTVRATDSCKTSSRRKLKIETETTIKAAQNTVININYDKNIKAEISE
jgi:hypothetical protein